MLRKITTALSALALVILGSIAIAPSANAASGGSYCFQYETNGYPYDTQPVYIQFSDDMVNWNTALIMNTDSSGCGAFYVYGDDIYRYVRAVARQEVRTSLGGVAAVWSGSSPLYGNPGNAAPSLGTGLVTCVSRSVYPCF
ncbi:hypothetical protein ACVWZ7_003897 [Arthrobacter sp. TE12232]